MDGDARETALSEQLVQFDRTADALDKNDDLVEVEGVEEVVELAVLLYLLQTKEVLLETVQGELRLVVDKDFERLSKH